MISPVIIKPVVFRDVEICSVGKATLRNRWGRQIVSLPLDEVSTLKVRDVEAARQGPAQFLDPQLELQRTQKGAEGVLCTFSDGSDLLCDGVVFCDGPNSVGRKFLSRRTPDVAATSAVACWGFVRRDLLMTSSWEFRTALGKSVEQLPLPDGLVRVRFRFRTPYGARQTASELRELFSEFGPDIEALLEGVEPEQIQFHEERDAEAISFTPTPGTLAIGEAALGLPLLGSFDWSVRAARRQLERVVESLLVENWEPEAFEPVFREVLAPILKAERYLRATLHYDNVFLRPLRDIALRLTPESVLRDRVRGRLVF